MNKQEKLYKKLEQYDSEGVSFYKAKKALLKDGYSESAISIAVASRPFDGIVNKPRVHDMAKFYAENPQAAKVVAQELLAHDAALRQRKARLDALAAAASNNMLGSLHPASIQSTARLGDQVGVSLLLVLGVGVLLIATLYGLYALHIVSTDFIYQALSVYGLGVGIILVVAFILSELRAAARKRRR